MIRKARKQDLPELDLLYENARNFMHTHGNPGQWNDGHPCSKDLEPDIDKGWLYVIEEDGRIHASFVYYEGEDPTYQYIDGSWLNDRPYGVAHKVASSGQKKGMGDQIISYLKTRNKNLKLDTHADNRPMKNLLERSGFIHVGTIYLADGSPRDAYHYVEKGE
ncbi:MAG: GNAT family N-acetyltransferase [Erysipelotrichaceae bacterium]|nr:GNAT family N-acetyltransferase [Erysipelotrichaceae bacterium]